jgi:hypothetical protein
MEGFKIDGKSAAVGAGAGALLGGVLVYLACRRSFNAKLNAEVDAVKRHYQLRADASASRGDNTVERPVSPVAEELGRDAQPMGPAISSDDAAEGGFDPLEGLDEEPEVVFEGIPDGALVWPPANRDRNKPYIISEDEFNEGAEGHQSLTITWYEGDFTLTDDQEKPLRDTRSYVGDISKGTFGGVSCQPYIMYVRNERLEIDFEIKYDERAYVDAVLNYGDPNPRNRK